MNVEGRRDSVDIAPRHSNVSDPDLLDETAVDAAHPRRLWFERVSVHESGRLRGNLVTGAMILVPAPPAMCGGRRSAGYPPWPIPWSRMARDVRKASQSARRRPIRVADYDDRPKP